MKRIIFALLVCIGLSTDYAFAQASVCGEFHKKACYMEGTRRDKRAFMYNAQSKSGLFAQGSTSKMRCVVYKGNDYRMSVCCEAIIGEKVNFKIYDARTKELLFDNTKNDNTQQFEFQASSTRQLIIEATVPMGEVKEEKGKAENAACVGLLIENKVSDRVGFSQY
ncbi:MAG TPA: hypothetical protein VK835_08920 [Bacteroidia bacterium]|jgi:hypothetical protein|nr:hypothetical protein [Bacteroidia bacterium]